LDFARRRRLLAVHDASCLLICDGVLFVVRRLNRAEVAEKASGEFRDKI
jgi:hypothetical protein